MSQAIDIDFRTSYSRIAIYESDQVKIIPDEKGNLVTSSYVTFTNNQCLISNVAKTQAEIDPQNTIFHVKRLIGRKFDEPYIQSYMKDCPFKIIKYENKVKIQVQFKNQTKLFSPEEISSMILTKMKEDAEKYLGKKISKAVVTVPASFTYIQRQAIADAAVIAGLNVLRLINEPTAAALAYNFDKKGSDAENILIFDLGGGILNVSVIILGQDVIEVKPIGADSNLGGEDFNNRMIKECIKEFQKKNDIDISDNKHGLR